MGALALAGVASIAPALDPSRAAAAPSTVCCARGALADSLAAALAGLADRAQVSVLAISLDRGDTLLASSPDRRMIPGSNTKVFTTSAFLRRFGPEARLRSRIEARGDVDRRKNGAIRLRGDLVLRPSGAPDVTQILAPGSLGLLDSLAFLLRGSGLERFEGTLWIDGTLFADEPYGPGWAIDDVAASYGAPTSAVLANGNAATLVATAGKKAVTVALEPPETPLQVSSRLTVADGGTNGWLDVDRLPGSHRLRVTGRIPRGGVLKRQVAVPEPDSTAGLWLLAALRRFGVETKATVRVVPHAPPPASPSEADPAMAPARDRSRGPAPPAEAAGAHGWSEVRSDRAASVVELDSPPAAQFVGVVNALSLNAEAEGLLRLLDPAAREKRRSGGLAEVRRIASEAGIDTLDLSLVDGSGLSPMNLLTARSLVGWLAAHARDTTLAGVFRSGLAAPGVQGTLRTRFAGLPPSADLHGKTGTLTNVSSLSGYVTNADGERIAFAVLTNGNRASLTGARQMEERLVGLLARSHRTPAGAVPPFRIPR